MLDKALEALVASGPVGLLAVFSILLNIGALTALKLINDKRTEEQGQCNTRVKELYEARIAELAKVLTALERATASNSELKASVDARRAALDNVAIAVEKMEATGGAHRQGFKDQADRIEGALSHIANVVSALRARQ